MSAYQTFIGKPVHAVQISDAHFGANQVARINNYLDGSPFERVSEALGFSHIRYPGGTVTEEYVDPAGDVWSRLMDPEGPDTFTLPGGEVFQSLSSVLAQAAQAGQDVVFVLPTAHFLTDRPAGGREVNQPLVWQALDDLKIFMESDPNAHRISTIEIGNEYYYQGRMSPQEYGDLVNAIVPHLAGDLEDWSKLSGHDVADIAVQAGPGYRAGHNEIIIDRLSPESIAAIDGVIIHYYPNSLGRVEASKTHFNQLDAWREVPGLEDVKFYVSEWNVQSSTETDLGFLQAGTMVAAFDEMIRQDVDMASIWGVQYKSLATRLSRLPDWDRGDEVAQGMTSELTAAGEMFGLISKSLPGLYSIDTPNGSWLTGPAGGLLVSEFGSDERFFSVVSNRDAEGETSVTLDLKSWFGQSEHLTLRLMVPVDNPRSSFDESQPDDQRALVDHDVIFSGKTPGELIEVALPPGAILVVDLAISTDGIHLAGQNPVSTRDWITYDDSLTGSDGNDTLIGHAGDDTLVGGSGDDLLLGGEGADQLKGGSGHDVLIGGDGDDMLFGGADSDALAGGAGNDMLQGGAGSDLLIASGGEDELYGGAGDDVFVIGAGAHTSHAGGGANGWVIQVAGAHNIHGFDPAAGDVVDLSALFTDQQSLNAAMSWHSDETGDLLKVRFNDEASMSIRGVAGSRADIEAAITADRQEYLQEWLDGADFTQIGTLFSEADSGTLAALTGPHGFADLFHGLEDRSIAAILSGLNDTELAEAVEALGSERAANIALNLEDDDLGLFLGMAAPGAAAGLIAPAGSDAIDTWLEDLPPHLQGAWSEVTGGLRDLPEARWDAASRSWELDDWMPTVPVSEEDDEQQPPPEEDQPQSVGGDCFVATVAYGGENHPDLSLLRWYRDMVLREKRSGRLFVRLYWTIGPVLARGLAQSPAARRISRTVLEFIVGRISACTGRTPGLQPDHRPWPENRRQLFTLREKHR